MVVGTPGTVPIWASAIKPEGSGVGVHQRHLYSRLARLGFSVDTPGLATSRKVAVQSFVRPIDGRYSAALICTTPVPAIIRVPFVLFVYDLRWRRTRGAVGRTYRYVDLRWSAARASHIFTISGRTREDLIEAVPAVTAKSEVLHLGPGVVEPEDFTEGREGAVLLAGGAAYKRNDVLASALVRAHPAWAQRFLCVGVGDAAFRTLVEGFGAQRCERLDGIDDQQMRAAFRRASVYVSASLEEGFGLPIVEALASGCQVIAIRQPVTEEVAGAAAVLIEGGTVADIADQLADPAWVSEDIRRDQVRRYSWDDVARTVAARLETIIDR